jgi:hypothetical protein
MRWLRPACGFTALLVAACVAQPVVPVAPAPVADQGAAAAPPAPWPDTPSTRAFRRRTLELAIIYGESGGLDENGYLIHTTDLGATANGCHRVRARTSLRGVPVGDEVIETCSK